MKTLVVGGAGFIGSHLCDALLEQKHHVICVDNFSLGTKANISHLKGNYRFVVYEADASDNKEIDRIFRSEELV